MLRKRYPIFQGYETRLMPGLGASTGHHMTRPPTSQARSTANEPNWLRRNPSTTGGRCDAIRIASVMRSATTGRASSRSSRAVREPGAAASGSQAGMPSRRSGGTTRV